MEKKKKFTKIIQRVTVGRMLIRIGVKAKLRNRIEIMIKMDKKNANGPRRLIDEKVNNLEPQPRELLFKMTVEENMRIKSHI